MVADGASDVANIPAVLPSISVADGNHREEVHHKASRYFDARQVRRRHVAPVPIVRIVSRLDVVLRAASGVRPIPVGAEAVVGAVAGLKRLSVRIGDENGAAGAIAAGHWVGIADRDRRV